MFDKVKGRPNEEPQPPAAAYRHVVAILTDTWIINHPPPVTGRRLIITGIDGKPTHWNLDATMAVHLSERLRAMGAPVTVQSADYDDREKR